VDGLLKRDDLVGGDDLLGADLRVHELRVLGLEIGFGDPTGHGALASDEDRHLFGDDRVGSSLPAVPT
jgi:hypothetical protein